MNISMVGIDYSTAKVEEREQFSLTAVHAVSTAANIIKKYGVSGCVVLSTCNRTELWFSGLIDTSPLETFLQEKGVPVREYGHLFKEREAEEAVSYLMELACGLHSQIFGEDQILTQVKQALQLAHENETADSVLEALFRTAITAAKRIKSEVKLTMKDQSIPQSAVAVLLQKLGSLKDKRCLIIGNGEMGRLTAQVLKEYQCKMFMTLRQYKKNNAVIPKECESIPYDHRVEYLKEADIIISATLSPHFTLQKQQLEGKLNPERQYIFIDLAVPRDIDPKISEFDNVELLDMDRLGIVNTCDEFQLQKANQIIEKYKKEYTDWSFYRNWIPVVTGISEKTAVLTNVKLKKTYQELQLNEETQEHLEEEIHKAAKKSITQLMYGMKDYLGKEIWKDCITAMELAARDSR